MLQRPSYEKQAQHAEAGRSVDSHAIVPPIHMSLFPMIHIPVCTCIVDHKPWYIYFLLIDHDSAQYDNEDHEQRTDTYTYISYNTHCLVKGFNCRQLD